MTTRSQSLQEPFLNALRKQKVPVAIYLTNGIKLQGQVSAFDQQVILLKNNTKQMVFKHAVATIVPSRNVVWHDAENTEEMPAMHDMEEEAIENF